eukprot:4614562-Prymnesium_polylepis.1
MKRVMGRASDMRRAPAGRRFGTTDRRLSISDCGRRATVSGPRTRGEVEEAGGTELIGERCERFVPSAVVNRWGGPQPNNPKPDQAHTTVMPALQETAHSIME